MMSLSLEPESALVPVVLVGFALVTLAFPVPPDPLDPELPVCEGPGAGRELMAGVEPAGGGL